MEAQNIEPAEIVKASAKLGREDATQIAEQAKKMIVAKGKKVRTFEIGKEGVTEDAVDAMLGPTGNLRAPCIRSKKLVLVGFNEDVYLEELA